MKLKMVLWVSLALFISSCSLAEDVTPPPVLATAQAAPRQQVATPVHPAAQATSGGLVELSPPETAPSILSGAAIFAESCEPCHGAQGLGAGSMSSNLEVEPPPLGKLDFARTARPLDWYGVVTEGRMERFMPPFRSLSDGQRWDVVAYALSLGYPPETSLRGASLYDETCAGCHGEAGQGAENAPPLNTSEIFAGYALDELLVTIQDGKGSMPAYADILPQEDQLLVAAYV
ncbi:MAG: c-type cytochrome, partial [Anaerolineales bacterium]